MTNLEIVLHKIELVRTKCIVKTRQLYSNCFIFKGFNKRKLQFFKF